MSILRTMARNLFGRKVEGTRIVPISTKIIVIFVLFILASSFSTNYINLMYNRGELVMNLKELLVKDLKQLYTYCNNQYEIYNFNKDLPESIKQIEMRTKHDFKKNKKMSIALGVKPDGSLLFQGTKQKRFKTFTDRVSLQQMEDARLKGVLHKGVRIKVPDGSLQLSLGGNEYYAVYKYNKKWGVYIIRAEELVEFYASSWKIFWNVVLISLLITIACSLVGIILLRYILRFVHIITSNIMRMSQEQTMELIDMKGAPNDDISYLGVAFNSLSSTIGNMMQIFQKFINRDVVDKAYREKNVKLEGTRKDLTCLFSDIRRFTYMTETLGTDIITMLNMHYDRAIREILEHDGIIGSIIGDALLAVYGALESSKINKSYQAVMTAYKIQEVALSLRNTMMKKRKDIEKRFGKFSQIEEKVYQAVLIEVGVGLDGGEVFYGNIGSNERMTNTVIGDNVNSASRLEGLTRIYNVPVICSEYIKKDIEDNIHNHGLVFMELDTVKVKGKTIGKKVYWPIPEKGVKGRLKQDIKYFSEGLKDYYAGKWRKAEKSFGQCKLEAARLFVSRIKGHRCPADWKGIWEMKTK